MPKYTQGAEWVEISGARHMPMSAFRDIYEGLTVSAPIINRVLKAHNLVDWDGAPVDMARTKTSESQVTGAEGEPQTLTVQTPYANVSTEQLTFIRDSIRRAITDEAIDPEA